MTKKKIPEQELALCAGEAAARILEAVQEAIDNQEVAQAWIDELTEILAKLECKRHYDLPAWSKLTPPQKRRLLNGVKKTLLTIRDFWSIKVAARG